MNCVVNLPTSDIPISKPRGEDAAVWNGAHQRPIYPYISAIHGFTLDDERNGVVRGSRSWRFPHRSASSQGDRPEFRGVSPRVGRRRGRCDFAVDYTPSPPLTPPFLSQFSVFLFLSPYVPSAHVEFPRGAADSLLSY